MRDATADLDHNGLLHLRRDHFADLLGLASGLFRLGLPPLLRQPLFSSWVLFDDVAPCNSFARRYVINLALSLRISRILRSPSSVPWTSGTEAGNSGLPFPSAWLHSAGSSPLNFIFLHGFNAKLLRNLPFYKLGLQRDLMGGETHSLAPPVPASTPSISNNILPGRITATQASGAPLPLPIRVSAGFFVIGLSGNKRIHTLPPRLMKRVIAIRAASILACRDPAAFHRLQTILAERNRRSSPGLSAHASPLDFAELNFLGHHIVQISPTTLFSPEPVTG